MLNIDPTITNLVLLESSKPSAADPITTIAVRDKIHVSQGELHCKISPRHVNSQSPNRNLLIIRLKYFNYSQQGQNEHIFRIVLVWERYYR